MRPETLLLALFAAGAGLLLLINAGNLGAARKSAPAVTHVVYTSDVGPPGGMPADDTPEAVLGLPESEIASTAPLSAASPPPPPLYARAAVAVASVPPLLKGVRETAAEQKVRLQALQRARSIEQRSLGEAWLRGDRSTNPPVPLAALERLALAKRMRLETPTTPTTTLKVHRILPPNNGAPWANIMATWDGVAGVEIVEHAADDLPALVQAAVPTLAPHVLRMRAAIERDDIAKYCALFLHGGVYADLDTELLSAPLLARAAASGRVLLASERVGAHNSAAPHVIVSPPRHPFWLALVSDLVERYDPRCYEPMNTGTMALTAFVNRAVCRDRNFTDVLVQEGLSEPSSLMREGGAGRGATRHFATERWVNARSEQRKRGGEGCAFRRRGLDRSCAPASVARLLWPPESERRAESLLAAG